MEINAIFAPTIKTPEHIVAAEELGYRGGWVYDVPSTSTPAARSSRTSEKGDTKPFAVLALS